MRARAGCQVAIIFRAVEGDILRAMPYTGPTSRAAWIRRVTHAFHRAGYATERAVCNVGGTCLTCGDDGHCPGVHILARSW